MTYKRNERNKVFISYCHHDLDWLKRLKRHLRPLERDLAIEIWDDTRIISGSNWREEIKVAVNSAKVAVLLVSADFLASDFIDSDELPPLLKAAQEDGATILPLIISPCRFTRTASLSVFQAANNPAKPLKGMNNVQQEEILDKVAQSIEIILNQQPKSNRANTPISTQPTEKTELREIEAKEERDKIRRILDKFDRNAISQIMHEENIFFMCNSLNELRIQIQKEGIISITDERIRELLFTIKDEISEIIILTLLLGKERPLKNWENSILDLRSIGITFDTRQLDPYFKGKGIERVKERFTKIYEFCENRIQNHFRYAKDTDHNILRNLDFDKSLEEAEKRGIEISDVYETIANEIGTPKSIDFQALSKDIATIYVFGCIDELKEQINLKITKVRGYIID